MTFKFPDELSSDADDNALDKDIGIEVSVDEAETTIDIVVEDDTPAADRNAVSLERVVEDPTEEEVASYGAKVQKRIKDLTHARHDERRRAEALQRERDELERITKKLMEERAQHINFINEGAKTHTETLKAKATTELDVARKALKEAHESYDIDAILVAQEAFAEAKLNSEATKNFRPTTLQPQTDVVQRHTQEVDVPKLDPNTQNWLAKNQWYGAPGYEDVTAFTLGYHKKLVTEGVVPATDDYFNRIDARLRQAFPETYGTTKAPPDKPRRPPAVVVAPGSRTSGAKTQVRLTRSQANTADRLGVSYEDYARAYVALEQK